MFLVSLKNIPARCRVTLILCDIKPRLLVKRILMTGTPLKKLLIERLMVCLSARVLITLILILLIALIILFLLKKLRKFRMCQLK